MAKIYTCTATIRVTVQADDEFDAPHEAGMHLDVGDIEWDVEEGTPRSAKTCEGKVVEVDGIKYKLTAL